MGTTLTGTTPQDTYDSLIKVTDNGPLSGTAKYLSDGLGNDSALALSTAGVGIGTSSVNQELEIAQTLDPTIRLTSTQTSSGLVGSSTGRIEFFGSSTAGSGAGIKAAIDTAATTTTRRDFDLIFKTGSNIGSGEPSESMRITSAGNVGIQTSTASRVLTLKNNTGSTNGISFQSSVSTSEIAAIECNQTLDTIDFEMVSNYAGHGFRFLTGSPTLVERARFTANGLCFNGDTLAANALDDYEEGTWTPAVSFGGASVGVTYNGSANGGTYTKVGRQVTINGILALTNKGSSTGDAAITGLPFTIPNSTSNYAGVAMRFENITFANQFQGYGGITTTTIQLEEITEAGAITTITNADFANNSTIMINFTYFV